MIAVGRNRVVSDPPSGWYEDPAARHAQRYWDGASWTHEVRDGDIDTDDPLPAGALLPKPIDTRADQPGGWDWLQAALGVAVVLGAVTLMYALARGLTRHERY